MVLAALLLTGGASVRMGRDKATLILGGTETLAGRTARLLDAVADPVLEVGGATTGLVSVADPWPGGGPLAAVAAGADALRLDGRGDRPVLVVATDLPGLTAGFLSWLAAYPSERAVVPVDGSGRDQVLCARYPLRLLPRVADLSPRRSAPLRSVLDGVAYDRPGPEDWAGPAGGPDRLDDVDTPEDLASVARIRGPGGASGPHPFPTPPAVPPSVAPRSVGSTLTAPGPVTSVRAVAVHSDRHVERPEDLATEEPLEIRAAGPAQESAAVSVTMRTPGDDFDLAAGFLVTEGLIRPSDIRAVGYCAEVDPELRWNTVTVSLAGRWSPDRPTRSFLTTSSCGVCGKASIDDVEVFCPAVPTSAPVPASLVLALPDRLRGAQRVFARTGGLHAAGLFSPAGELVCLREDVGRHNAVDKVVGRQALRRHAPDPGSMLVVSGRVSFEIVQKAAMARIGMLVAVSAPSSLAVDAAARLGVTVAGFVREGRMNVYSHPQRVLLPG